MSHVNSGNCLKCKEIMDKYPGMNQDLRDWLEEFQAACPEVHVSCAGRGRVEQESDYQRGASRAHYGQSAHNFNCAVDTFVMIHDLDLYDKHWFQSILGPKITSKLEWYGLPGASFYELPHIQIKNWKDLVQQGLAKLVE